MTGEQVEALVPELVTSITTMTNQQAETIVHDETNGTGTAKPRPAARSSIVVFKRLSYSLGQPAFSYEDYLTVTESQYQ